MKSLDTRIRRLEQLVKQRDHCPECGGYPTRIVGLDEDTDAVTSEAMPESGCPACGREPRHTVALVGIDVADVFGAHGNAG